MQIRKSTEGERKAPGIRKRLLEEKAKEMAKKAKEEEDLKAQAILDNSAPKPSSRADLYALFPAKSQLFLFSNGIVLLP